MIKIYILMNIICNCRHSDKECEIKRTAKLTILFAMMKMTTGTLGQRKLTMGYKLIGAPP